MAKPSLELTLHGDFCPIAELLKRLCHGASLWLLLVNKPWPLAFISKSILLFTKGTLLGFFIGDHKKHFSIKYAFCFLHNAFMLSSFLKTLFHFHLISFSCSCVLLAAHSLVPFVCLLSAADLGKVSAKCSLYSCSAPDKKE